MLEPQIYKVKSNWHGHSHCCSYRSCNWCQTIFKCILSALPLVHYAAFPLKSECVFRTNGGGGSEVHPNIPISVLLLTKSEQPLGKFRWFFHDQNYYVLLSTRKATEVLHIAQHGQLWPISCHKHSLTRSRQPIYTVLPPASHLNGTKSIQRGMVSGGLWCRVEWNGVNGIKQFKSSTIFPRWTTNPQMLCCEVSVFVKANRNVWKTKASRKTKLSKDVHGSYYGL